MKETSNGTEVLSVKGLSFRWKNASDSVLSDIEFSVKDGELVAILGINGAGKSTLLKCLNRILTPQSGEIEIESTNINDVSLLDLSKLVSYVPQSVMSNFSMDVFDVVMLGRRPHISWRISNEDRDKVSKTLELFDLEDFAFRRFDQLSGGERQRVIVAKAVVQSPSLYLFDEPTSDLDLKNQIEVMKRIRDLVDDEHRRRSALVAVHDINLASRFADRIILLHNGQIKAFDTPQSVLNEQNIAEVFGVKCTILSATDESPMRVLVEDEIPMTHQFIRNLSLTRTTQEE